jgi:hypothetical protein
MRDHTSFIACCGAATIYNPDILYLCNQRGKPGRWPFRRSESNTCVDVDDKSDELFDAFEYFITNNATLPLYRSRVKDVRVE